MKRFLAFIETYKKSLYEGKISQEQYDQLIAVLKKRMNIPDEIATNKQEILNTQQVQEKIETAQKELEDGVEKCNETLAMEALSQGANPQKLYRGSSLLHCTIQKMADNPELLKNKESQASLRCIIWQLAFKKELSKEERTALTENPDNHRIALAELSEGDLALLKNLNDNDPEEPFAYLLEEARENR